MKNEPAVERSVTGATAVLSVSPVREDQPVLESASGHSGCKLYRAAGIQSALAILRQRNVAVVLCEDRLSPGTWVDMLERLRLLPDPPPLIVTSRVADERLWIEALNLGAYDVLAKPLVFREVVRSLDLAWSHWVHRRDSLPDRASVMRAAG